MKTIKIYTSKDLMTNKELLDFVYNEIKYSLMYDNIDFDKLPDETKRKYAMNYVDNNYLIKTKNGIDYLE